MNKLNFPKDCNAIETVLNKLPTGKYKLTLSTPEAGKDWLWSNGKTGYLFTAHIDPKKDGSCEAGLFAGSAVVKEGKIDSEFTVYKTKNHTLFEVL